MYLHMKEEYINKKKQTLVRNSHNEIVYVVNGHWGRAGDKVTLYDIHGQELAAAKQIILSLFPKFDLTENRKYIGTVTKHPGILGQHPYFTVSHLDWTIRGNFEKRQFTVYHNSQRVMFFQKSFGDKANEYFLFVTDEEDATKCCVLACLVDHYMPKNGPKIYLRFNPNEGPRGFKYSAVDLSLFENEKTPSVYLGSHTFLNSVYRLKMDSDSEDTCSK